MSTSNPEKNQTFSWNENYKADGLVLESINAWITAVSGSAPVGEYSDIFTPPLESGSTVNVTCTDERPIDLGTVPDEDRTYEFLRVAGGAAGLLGAIESVKPAARREDIVRELSDIGLNIYNHIDNVHGSEEEKVGCGYLSLLSMGEAPRVFGKKIADVHTFIEDMERNFGVPTLTLQGEHVAQNGGFLINLNTDRALDPNTHVHGAFFSFDLGGINMRLGLMDGVLSLTPEQRKQILIRLTRDNMIACYVLSGGNIDGTKFLVTGTSTSELREVIEEAYQQFSEPQRMEAMNQMIEDRGR